MDLSSHPWSAPTLVEDLRANRGLLPNLPGVYVFTNFDDTLRRCTGVLYVGEAGTKGGTLRTRVPSYLVDPAELQVGSRKRPGEMASSLKHAAKALLLTEIQQRSREGRASGIWIRWVATAAHKVLEAELIAYLQPAFNIRGR